MVLACIGLLLRFHLPLATLGVLSWAALQLPAAAEAPEWVNVIAFLAIAAHMCSAYQVFAQPVSEQFFLMLCCSAAAAPCNLHSLHDCRYPVG